MSDYNPDADPRSSNSLIRGYLASKGLPLNGENVRRALEANFANPGTIKNSSSTLVNSLPSTEADDQAAMAAARGRSGGRGIPTPPVPPGASTPPPAQQDTSAAPGGSGSGDEFPWLAALAGGAGAAMAPLLRRLRGSGASETRVPGGPGQPSFDVGDISLSMNRPQFPPPVDVGGAQVNLGQPRLLPNAASPSLGAGIVNGEPLSIGAPAPQPAAPQSTDGRPVVNPNESIQPRGPGASDVIPLPAPAAAAPPPQITDQVPAIDAPAPRVKTPRTRASRARTPPRI